MGILKLKTGTEDTNWRIVRNRVFIRALLIFLGVILMQMLAYMVCVLGVMAYGVLSHRQTLEMMEQLAKANTQSGTFIIAISLVSAVLSGIWCGVLYWKSDWRQRPFDYRSAFSGNNTLAIVGIGVGGCMLLTMFLTGLAALLPEIFHSYNMIMERLTDSSITMTFIYVLLIGPVSEELIFRGAILDRFYLAFPYLIANLLQAVLFGIYHMNLIQGLYAFCLGFVLGLVRYVSGSILASVLTHILFNTTSYVLDFVFPMGKEMQVGVIILVVVIGAVLCFFSLRYFWREFQKQVSKMEGPDSVSNSQ